MARVRATHCKNGHEWNEENTYIPPGREGNRQCRRCNIERRAASTVYEDATCPMCGATRRRQVTNYVYLYADGTCQKCAAALRNKLAAPAAMVEERPKPRLISNEWRTDEELEPYESYWTSRYTSEEIRYLASHIDEVKDTGGFAAGKRNRNSQSKLKSTADTRRAAA